MSEYANLGREIAVNETLKAVSAVRISKSDLGQTAIAIVVWKLLYSWSCSRYCAIRNVPIFINSWKRKIIQE